MAYSSIKTDPVAVMTNTMTLTDIFTEEEIGKLEELYDSVPDHEFSKRAADEIVTPALPRINAALGQENDARYLAYATQHVFNQVRASRRRRAAANGGGPKP